MHFMQAAGLVLEWALAGVAATVVAHMIFGSAWDGLTCSRILNWAESNNYDTC